MNSSVVVSSLVPCEMVEADELEISAHPIWRQTLIGCQIIMLLKEMLHLHISYELVESAADDEQLRRLVLPQPNTSVDMYAKPMTYREDLLQFAAPVQYIYSYRIGFLLVRPDLGLFRSFFWEPFHGDVWRALGAMVLVATLVLYCCGRGERRILRRGDPHLCYALFVALAACCQQMPPLLPVLLSRRIALFTLSVFVYIVHAYYTSNLLSHLVSDRNDDFDLDTLYQSSYTCVVLDAMKININQGVSYQTTRTKQVLPTLRSVTAAAGIAGVRHGQLALLSDYTTFYSIIRKTFTAEEVCQLVELDVYPKVATYLFSSKNFSMMEEFKIGILRIREAGILKRTVDRKLALAPSCLQSPAVSIQLPHVVTPLLILAAAAGLATVFMLVQRCNLRATRRRALNTKTGDMARLPNTNKQLKKNIYCH